MAKTRVALLTIVRNYCSVSRHLRQASHWFFRRNTTPPREFQILFTNHHHVPPSTPTHVSPKHAKLTEI